MPRARKKTTATGRRTAARKSSPKVLLGKTAKRQKVSRARSKAGRAGARARAAKKAAAEASTTAGA